MNESMNADSQIIHFSLTANPRPTVLKFGGDFYGHGLVALLAQQRGQALVAGFQQKF